MTPIYLLDANLFIQGWRQVYPIGVFGPLWRAIADASVAGSIVSLVQVRAEIKYPKELVRWVEAELASGFFMEPSEAAFATVRDVLRVVHDNPRYAESEDFERFANGADPFLIAAAKADGYVLVTFEVPEKKQSGPNVQVKIPDVCAEMGVRCITPSEMFVELGIELG